ncbi:hypothetical protein J6590_018379 [Homalodisca vitripennis]|nr:hypothetical protein J6590_018379 [Homalodisca vitripennis]
MNEVTQARPVTTTRGGVVRSRQLSFIRERRCAHARLALSRPPAAPPVRGACRSSPRSAAGARCSCWLHGMASPQPQEKHIKYGRPPLLSSTSQRFLPRELLIVSLYRNLKKYDKAKTNHKSRLKKVIQELLSRPVGITEVIQQSNTGINKCLCFNY